MLIAAVGLYALTAALFFLCNYKYNKMKIKIKNPFKILSEHFEKPRHEESIAHVKRCVQLRELEGKIWPCYDNIPTVEQSQLKDTLGNTVASTREAVCRYFKIMK